MFFEWDAAKNLSNQLKHGVSFEEAQRVFDDPNAVFIRDPKHSEIEQRYQAIGEVDQEILTVVFTYRAKHIRIITAGRWRIGRKIYEQERD